VERASELPVAIAVASRPEAFRREQSLIVIGDRARASCNLAPLNADQVSLILEDLLPAIDPRVAREIATVSGGNALLVHQLALGIADGDPAEAWSATDADGIVHGYVSRRIAELSPTARALLDAAAVLGNGAAWRVGRNSETADWSSTTPLPSHSHTSSSAMQSWNRFRTGCVPSCTADRPTPWGADTPTSQPRTFC
jgi:hypothetical protein